MSIVTLNDRAVRSVTTFGSLNTGSMVFIKKLTASSSSDLSFVNGTSDVVLDSTYKEYLFTFNNIHPATDGAHFQVNFRDGSTAYDATKTTSFFYAYHDEGGGTPALSYVASEDLAQSTSSQRLTSGQGNANDESASGYLHLFNPSSTTFVKHFITHNVTYQDNNSVNDNYVAGYINTTSAIDEIQFKFDDGNIDSGTFQLFGVV